MVRIVFLTLFLIFVTGCAETIRVKTEVQESMVPVLYCPAPPKIERPELPIQQMTQEQIEKDGEVVKHYKATVKTLLGYGKELEAALIKYEEINKKYEEEKKKVEHGIEMRKNENKKEQQ